MQQKKKREDISKNCVGCQNNLILVKKQFFVCLFVFVYLCGGTSAINFD